MAKPEADPRRITPLGIGISIPATEGKGFEARAFVIPGRGGVLALYRVEDPQPVEAAQGIRFVLREIARFDARGIAVLSRVCRLFQETYHAQD